MNQIPMSAKLIENSTIDYSKPPPVPLLTVGRATVEKLDKCLRSLTRIEKMFVGCPESFVDALRQLREVRGEIGGELPGMPEKEKPRARASLEEIIRYCIGLKLDDVQPLAGNDGHWFFDKMLAAGWKNGGKPVNDVFATIRTWARMGTIFPSHKCHGASNGYGNQPKPVNRVGQEIDRDLARIRKEGSCEKK